MIMKFVIVVVGNEDLNDEGAQDLEPTEPQSKAEAKGYTNI